MTRNRPWYIGQRAEQLAIVALSRRSDLVISQAIADSGLDFQIQVGRASPGRIFGVQVKGAIRKSDVMTVDFEIKRSIARSLADAVADYPFPVALIVFESIDDAGYFGWLLEPIIQAARSKLKHRPNIRVVRMDDLVIDHAVSLVGRWYDCRKPSD